LYSLIDEYATAEYPGPPIYFQPGDNNEFITRSRINEGFRLHPEIKHPIVNNLDGLKFEFTNPIDTLKNNIKKTILLQSSTYSRLVGTPVEVSLSMVSERPEKDAFKGLFWGIMLG
jgi:hypothetical protein